MKGTKFAKTTMVLIVLFLCTSLLPAAGGMSLVQASEREIRVGLYFGNTARHTVTLSTDVNAQFVLTDGHSTYQVGNYQGEQSISILRSGSRNVLPVYEEDNIEDAKARLEELKEYNPILVYDHFWFVVVDPSHFNSLSYTIPELENTTLSLNGFVEVSLMGKDAPGPVFYYKQLNGLHGIQIHSDGEFIKLNNNNNERYRGFIEVAEVANRFKVINQVNLELYLRGVVPYEMSPSWHIEALKAQTVAARTYAIRNWNKFSSQNFNVCDTTTSQVYRGYNPIYETSRVIEAIDSTKGQVITVNNTLIDAVYHSHSGGHTENSENIWVSAVSYLKGKPDPFSTRSGSSLDRWVYDTVMDGTDGFGRKGFRTMLIENNYIPNNFFIEDITLTKMSSAGTETRVTEMTVNSTDGRQVKLTSGQVWSLLYSNNSAVPTSQRYWSRFFDVELNSVFAMLESNGSIYNGEEISLKKALNSDGTLNDVQAGSDLYVLDSSGEVVKLTTTATGVKFSGSGWGHGVGMSQWGAKQMAEEGYKYDEILQYYYTGVNIRTN